MARERKRVNCETERRMTARWLGLSTIGPTRVEKGTQTSRGEMGPLLPASDGATQRGSYTRVRQQIQVFYESDG